MSQQSYGRKRALVMHSRPKTAGNCDDDGADGGDNDDVVATPFLLELDSP